MLAGNYNSCDAFAEILAAADLIHRTMPLPSPVSNNTPVCRANVSLISSIVSYRIDSEFNVRGKADQ